MLFEGEWYELEGFILDKAYLSAPQRKFCDCSGAFCGYGVAAKDFRNPAIDWDRNNTYIQSEGIIADFGIYPSPDALLKETRTGAVTAESLCLYAFRQTSDES